MGLDALSAVFYGNVNFSLSWFFLLSQQATEGKEQVCVGMLAWGCVFVHMGGVDCGCRNVGLRGRKRTALEKGAMGKGWTKVGLPRMTLFLQVFFPHLAKWQKLALGIKQGVGLTDKTPPSRTL